MNLAELQKEAHAIAKEKGWWDQERTFGDCIARVHSELSEALEAYRGWPGLEDKDKTPVFATVDFGIPHGVAYELADVVIRVADMAEWYECPLESFEVTGLPPELPMLRPVESFGDWIAALHWELSGLSETWWATDGDIWAWKPHAECVVAITYGMADHYGIDLDAAIVTKMECLRRTERC